MIKLRTLLLAIACLLMGALAFAQVPQTISYQAVVRGGNNQLFRQKTIKVQISILQESDNGNRVYVETHRPTTDDNGLFSIEIGGGQTSQNFSDIDWSRGPYFLKTEIDPEGGSNYSIVAVNQMLAVPYAFYAATSGSNRDYDYSEILNAPTNLSDFTNDVHFIITEVDPTVPEWAKTPDKPVYDYLEIQNTPDLSVYITSETDPTVPEWAKTADKPTYDYSEIQNTPEQQTLSIGHDTLYLSGGSFVELPSSFSGDYNELTNKPIIPANVSDLLNDAGYIITETDPMVPEWAKAATKPEYQYSEILNAPADQTLRISNDTIYLSGTDGESSVKLPAAATGGFGGDYNDLINKPDIPASTSDLTNDSGFITASDVPVQVNADWNATEGVAEILNKPTIPTVPTNVSEFTNDAGYITASDVPAQVNADWNATEGLAVIQNKPTIPTSTSQLTNDAGFITADEVPEQVNADWNATEGLAVIQNKPTIPTVPTNVSDFTNDVGYITASDVPAQVNADWEATEGAAVIQNKPTIPTVPTNVSEFTNDAGYITATDVPTQVNADWEATEGAAVIQNKPTIPTVPTNVSEFTNDAGYITASDVPAQVNADWNATEGAAVIQNKPTIPTVPTNVSGFTNDAGYITASDVPAQQQVDWNATEGVTAILNKPTIPTVPTNISAFTNDANYVTSANVQEAANVPTLVSAFTNDAGYLTSEDITEQQNADWEAEEGTPAYIQNKPTIPTVPTNVSDFTNDAGYITEEDIPAQVNADWEATEGAAVIQNKPTIPTTTSQLTNNSGFITATDVPSQVNADWNATEGAAVIQNKPTIPTVPTNVSEFTNDVGYITATDVPAQVNADWEATEGAAVIQNKPTIPTVPTNVSEFTNDAGYITATDVPTQVNADWEATEGAAVIQNKPTIPTTTSQLTNNSGFITATDVPSQVNADWNATEGAAVIQNKPTIPTVPTNVSEFTNDVGYITATDVPSQVNADWEATEGAAVIQNKPTIPTVPTNVSEFTNDAGYITATDVPAQVNADWEATEGAAVIQNKPTIPTTTSQLTNNSGFITASDVPEQVNADWNATEGAAVIQNKPTIPTVPTNVSEFTNDVGYITATDVPSQVNADWEATEGAAVIQNKPTIPTVPTNVSEFTNDAGYLTEETQTHNLADVAALGNEANTQLKNVTDPTENQDAATKLYVDNLITTLRSTLLDSIANVNARHADELADLNSDIDSIGHIADSLGIVVDSLSNVIDSLNNLIENNDQLHEAVDLGLPSGTKWATTNVGANSPDELGDFFAWGETTTKPDYTEGNWTYTGTESVLSASNDAATANWGEDWRMPTGAEMSELINSCTWQWTTFYGVNGYKVTGLNGKSIFLPYGSGYWSSSANTNAVSEDYKWSLGISQSEYASYDIFGYFGFAVRPVKDGNNPSAFDLPSITTNTPINITSNSAVCGGAISDGGSSEVTSRGICWNTTGATPTIADEHMEIGSGVGYFATDMTNLESSTTYYVRAYATNSSGTAYGNMVSFTTASGHEYADLGLSVKWATTNLGADTPEGVGDFYAWGETTPGTDFTQDNYTYLDNPGVLPATADAATVSWGDQWRLPTEDEIQELIRSCTWTWTTQNGASGYLVSNNGSSIFLPATGVMMNTEVQETDYLVYWTSSIDVDNTGKATLLMGYEQDKMGITLERFYGAIIRPVYGERATSEVAPNVITGTVSNVTTTSATCEGGVTFNGGAEVIEQGICWSIYRNPTIDDSHQAGSLVESTFSVDLTGLVANTTYHIRAYATNSAGTSYGSDKTFTTPSGEADGHNYVDLGLPSGLKWATCNLWAPNPQYSGIYFAWGEITAKLEYTQETYVFDGSPESLSLANDAANSMWGTNWRMPTNVELQELIDYCTWVEDSENGLPGFRVIGNGNSIFLPATGYQYSTELTSYGEAGAYWSSSIDDSETTNAMAMLCSSDVKSISGAPRYMGMVIRPVYDEDGGESGTSGTTTSENAPEVTTKSVSDITNATATFSCEVTSDGGGTLTACGVCWSTSQNPTIDNDTTSEQTGFGVGDFTSAISGLSANTTYYIRAYATNGAGTSYGEEFTITTPTDEIDGQQYVDLGLASGKKWAYYNVGAGIPEDYGDYYAWGETTTKDEYSWSNYAYGTAEDDINKYNAEDNKTTLDPEDDAAAALWLNGWHMPTDAEMQELLTCTWTWTSQNGVNGYKVVGPNGNFIFLPASGNYNGTEHVVGVMGSYWVNSILSIFAPYSAMYLMFTSSTKTEACLSRYAGFTIRAVNGEASSGTFTDTRDGNTYEYLTIGEQTWMAENLKYLPSVVGPTTGSETESYYYVYGYEGTDVDAAKATENYATYGVLYNLPAAMNGASSSEDNPSGVQGVCPSGWHMPSIAEWRQLGNALLDDNHASQLAGNADLWQSGNLTNAVEFGASGFSALPGGCRYYGGGFGNLGNHATFWSTTDYSGPFGYAGVYHNDTTFDTDNDTDKEVGFSVRCVRD